MVERDEGAEDVVRLLFPVAPEPAGKKGRLRVAIYARFSSERQHERSIERQVELCLALIERLGLVLVATYEDRGKSGRTMAGRHELHRALADAKSGLFDILMVEDVDRLARRQSDAHLIKERLVH
ncbi:recombinase family protein [Lichenihabitans sp. Uapishka_5]|uniref:recombinase family protein n=1 Tax=Lichenihabitans sp. Uapishka_5 TaxID=3037302 RepID=UPI0029E822D7|nr:recombinase family protein [Lichenihabitans sp. Uapishka_5]MDX7951443.1 recombinase family protein [Lichenihabitans sp. Uapishka_5]